MLKVTTESGSIYEFDLPNLKMRRINTEFPMRREKEWLNMLTEPYIRLGEPLRAALEPLGHGDVTMRYSTPVTAIEEII